MPEQNARRLTPPVHLGIPRPAPEPAPSCDVCAALVHERRLAEAREDRSKVSDLNIELRNHPHEGRR
ncbi:hypothetical protein SSP35_07_02320 [Streptomyces sp. NBRC 110611]|uniref:hypothetical protein n=1 Tax=Streptomyces sp. NBRC 110611 TaxID=1621259 RepID=UPI00083499B8|nr:hypothetical protein [Streptomyces sp. NBRC 110611]GAU68430.1 hypothetical protein SSP35_07_02320 [Streptomyces sp. NBRC 110611]